MNLLQETLIILKENGKTINDIEFVGVDGVEIPIATFIDLADNEYDNDFGGCEVNVTLIVVGVDWWLERNEYDGSEWWEYKTKPKRPCVIQDNKSIFYFY